MDIIETTLYTDSQGDTFTVAPRTPRPSTRGPGYELETLDLNGCWVNPEALPEILVGIGRACGLKVTVEVPTTELVPWWEALRDARIPWDGTTPFTIRSKRFDGDFYLGYQNADGSGYSTTVPDKDGMVEVKLRDAS